MKAQGNALGVDFTKNASPERATQPVSPFQGLPVGLIRLSQGVALGFHVVPLRGGKQQTSDG